MGSFAAFLPPHLVRSLARTGLPARLPEVERLDAALLLSDVSGFTALTERLQARGREGAEEVARAIDSVFAPAIRAIEAQGGSIVSFGGDALFAIFCGGGRVHRAAAAAEAIRGAPGRSASGGGGTGLDLAISQAIHEGEVLGIHLGGLQRRHYVVAGRPVAALARLEGKAARGEIVLSAPARASLGSERRLRPPVRSGDRAPSAALAAYLDPRLRPLLRTFEGAYRRVAVLFLETRGARAEALQRFHVGLVEILDRTGGVLLKTDLSCSGTKWICVFGIPEANEDDPDRAARAALEAVAIPRGPQVRAGLHGGVVVNLVVGGAGRRRSFDVMGDVVNTAARVLESAAWGEALVTSELERSLSGVASRGRGRLAVKGKAEPLALHVLLEARATARPLRVAVGMVGRDAELRRLALALDAAERGEGAVIAIGGDAGVGKSRLAHEARRIALERGFAAATGRAASFGGMAHWAIASLVRSLLGLADAPGRTEISGAVRGVVERLGQSEVARQHLLLLLGVRDEDSHVGDGKPADVRSNILLAVASLCQAFAAERPQLLVLEDMQRADELTRDVVPRLARVARASRLLVLAVGRPGYEPPEGSAAIALEPLDDAATRELVHSQIGAVPASVEELVRQRAEGNPFYVEELVRHLVETRLLEPSGERSRLAKLPTSEDVPGSLESLVAARLDRLSRDAQRIAEVAAVVGRRFSRVLVATPGRRGGARSDAAISELLHRDVVLAEEGRGGFVFKQALVRDVVYGRILASRRRTLHGEVARLLARASPPPMAELGHHWESAGQAARARRCYLSAARQASKAHANEEAERLYRAHLALGASRDAARVAAKLELGRDVLRVTGRNVEATALLREALSDARARRDPARVVDVLAALGGVLRPAGHVEEASRLLAEGLALARRHRLGREAASVLLALGQIARDTGRSDAALAHIEDAHRIARGLGDRTLECQILINRAIWCQERGRVPDAIAINEQLIAICRELGRARSEATALGNLAVCYWEQGELERAAELCERAIAIARKVGFTEVVAKNVGNLAVLLGAMGRVAEAREHYERAIAMDQALFLPGEEAAALGNLANLHLDQGREEEAERCFRRALAIHRLVEGRRNEALVLDGLAAVLRRRGRLREAIATMEQALSLHREVVNRRAEGITLMNLAELRLDHGEAEAAVSLVQASLEAHREIGNRPFEALSLLLHARILRIAGGDLSLAEERSRAAVEQLRRQEEVLHIGHGLCELGHARLARGLAARDVLEEADTLARRLAAGEGSLLAASVACLRRAVVAFEAGRPLVRGSLRRDLPRAYRGDGMRPGHEKPQSD